jgi:hypothetical protein
MIGLIERIKLETPLEGNSRTRKILRGFSIVRTSCPSGLY